MVSLVLRLLLALGTTKALPLRELQASRLRAEDYKFFRSLPTYRGALPAGFKAKYVTQGGRIHSSRLANCLEVAGSPGTSRRGVVRAAKVIAGMVRHMPWDIFHRLTIQASVGVFTKAETLTVFPEYTSLRNTANCGSSCGGSCRHTCTFDGRKYDSLAGTGGPRAVIVEDNLLCTPRDAYFHRNNVLVHEFAHTIGSYGLDPIFQGRLTAAYNAARARHTWRRSDYVMANVDEYFAEATGCFFNVNRLAYAGGMNECGGRNGFCETEVQARQRILQRDSALFSILSHVYTRDQAWTPSGLTICP